MVVAVVVVWDVVSEELGVDVPELVGDEVPLLVAVDVPELVGDEVPV